MDLDEDPLTWAVSEELNRDSLVIPSQLKTSDLISLNWIIKDFDKLYEACDDEGSIGDNNDNPSRKEFAHMKFITGTVFGIRSDGKFFFTKEQDNVGLLLQLCCPCAVQGTKIQASFSVSTETKKGELIFKHNISNHDLSQYDVWGYKNFMKITELRQKYLNGGVLTMRLTVKLSGTTQDLMISTNNEVQGESINNDVAHNFGELFQSGQFSDVVFVFSRQQNQDQDTTDIKAHKMLLSARSPIFAAMFNAGMQEGITGKVMIQDISGKAFKMLLEFIYTGKLNKEWGSIADELIYAANKYELPTLKEILDQNILDVITVNNAIKVRKMAKLCNLRKAQDAIEIFTKDRWAEFLDMIEN